FNSKPRSCANSQPDGTPDLFQIDVNNTQAILYFVPASKADKYFISYGNGKNTDGYGIEFNSDVTSGVLSYSINHLTPNTEYSFKVRGGNGCMPGEWGNVMTVKTGNSAIRGASFYKNFLSRILSFSPRQVSMATNGG